VEKKFIISEEKGNMEVRKILQRNDGVKYLIVPKNSKFEKNDYVKLIKLQEVN
jgi:hypothetical protein